jgi:hypothetical protein
MNPMIRSGCEWGWRLGCLLVLGMPAAVQAAPPVTPAGAKAALLKAVAFYHGKAATHGGYVYRYSGDFTLREAEGIPGPETIWIQPPGTPAVGLAFLDAYEATGDATCLKAALDAAHALSRTQLSSGGWYYSGGFSPAERSKWLYRRDVEGKLIPGQTRPSGEAGWHAWKVGKHKGDNLTTLDDDVTQSAIRLLVRADKATGFKDEEIHEAAKFALETLLKVQYPAGGWSTSHETMPDAPPAAGRYPLKQASFPETWSRTWTKDFTGCYVTNDNLHATAVDALILASQVYQEPRYLDAAKRAGDFLLLAQLPEPQPAWAQHYDENMQPVWGRAFECPAVSGRESQSMMWTLLRLAAVTGDKKYLKPVPPAVVYLRKIILPSGKLARFYEIGTNKPLYFKRGPGGKGHELTYEDDRTASNYGWLWEPELDLIQATWQRINTGAPVPGFVQSRAPAKDPTDVEVAEIVAAMDSQGAWAEKEGDRGIMRDANGKKISPPGGVIYSETFVKNVQVLSRWLAGR